MQKMKFEDRIGKVLWRDENGCKGEGRRGRGCINGPGRVDFC